jgi:hypothetical protein
MPRIITRCPTTGEDVPTGHRTQDLDLAEMVGTRSFRCPVCNAIHAWGSAEARVETGFTDAALRAAAA